MADIVTTAEGRLVVRDDTAGGINSASRNFERLYGVVRNNWWGLQNIGSAFSALGGAMAAGIGGAAKAAADFEQGLSGVRRTANLTDAETVKMGESLRALALTKPVGVGVLSDIAKDAGALGINGVKSITEFTSVIADLVATTDLTADSAVQLARLAGVTNLSSSEYRNLGSAILVAGRSTAATETQIVNFSVRLSGVAATAGFTADQIVAVSAATLSLGSNAEAGSSAISRTIGKMATAVGNGGQKLLDFAHIAGYTGPKAAEEFAAAFQDSAAGTLARFVSGLGSISDNAVQTQQALTALGITNVREKAALLELAKGTQQNVNSYLNLRNALKLTNDAYAKGTEVQRQAARMYQTTENQLKILHNTLHDVGISFGSFLLAPLNTLIGTLANVAAGLAILPGPIKAATLLVGAMGAGILLLAAAFVTLGPRMVLVKGVLNELRANWAIAAKSAQLYALSQSQVGKASELSATRAAFAAGVASKARKADAAAAYTAAINSQLEGVNARFTATMLGILTAKENALALARHTAAVATGLSIEATRLSAEADALEAAGKSRAATAARAKATAAQEAAGAALAEAQASRAAAVAAEEEALAAETAAVAERNAAGAKIASAGASGVLAGATYVLGAALRFLIGPIGWVLLAVSAVTTIIGLMGHAHRKAAKDIADTAEANASLVTAMRQQASGTKDAVAAFYLLDQEFLRAAASARDFGYAADFLLQVLLGTAQQTKVNAFFDDLRKKYEQGDEAAGKLYNQVYDLIAAHNASAKAFATQTAGAKAAGVALDDVTASTDNLADANNKLKESYDQINQAILALPDALIAQADAQEAVKEATANLITAEEAAARHAEAVLKAEDDLTTARINQQKATKNLADAQRALSTARARAAAIVADAEDKLASDQDKLIDSTIKVRDLEAELAQLREGPSADMLRDATNKLRDAQLKLLDSTKAVGDAQYMLNYLQGEGASARDLQDAADGVAHAQADQADAAASAADAQKEYDKILAGADPEAIAAKERELDAARRDLAATTREIAQDEADLQQARDDLANDTLYKEAQVAITEAQIALDEANQSVIDSTRALADERKKDPADEVAARQRALEDALYRLAKANVEVQKQTALAHGEQFGAGREAQALAAQLSALGAQAGGKTHDDFARYAAILRQAKKDMDTLNNTPFKPSSTSGGGGPGAAPVALPDGGKLAEKTGGGFVQWFKDHAVELAISVVSAVALAFLAVVGFIPATIAAAIAGAIILIVAAISAWGPEIGNAAAEAFVWVYEQIAKIPGWVGGALETAWGAFTGFLASIGRWAGGLISSIGSGFVRGFATLAAPLALAAANVWNFFTRDIPNFVSGLPGVIGRIAEQAVEWLLRPFGNLPSTIANLLSGLGDILARIFRSAVNGPIDIWNGFIGWLAGLSFTIDFPDWIPGLPDSFTMGFGFMNGLKIPRLATGGIAMNPMLAKVGDNSSGEAIIPLTKLYDMFKPVDLLAMQVASTNSALQDLIALSNRGGDPRQGDTINIEAHTDADAVEIAEEVVWAKMVRVR